MKERTAQEWLTAGGSELGASFCPDPSGSEKAALPPPFLLHPAICAVPAHLVPSRPSGGSEPGASSLPSGHRSPAPPHPQPPAPPRGSGLYTELGQAPGRRRDPSAGKDGQGPWAGRRLRAGAAFASTSLRDRGGVLRAAAGQGLAGLPRGQCVPGCRSSCGRPGQRGERRRPQAAGGSQIRWVLRSPRRAARQWLSPKGVQQ